MNTIQEFRHNRLLAKEFDIKEATPSPTLASEIQPVAIVSDLTRDDPFIGAVNDYVVVASEDVAGVAANFSTVQLQNPVGSGVVAVIELLVIAGGGSAQVGQFSLGDALNGGFLNTQPKRLSQRPVVGDAQPGQCKLFTGVQVGALAFFLARMRLGAVPIQVELLRGLVLDEGGLLSIQNTTAAAQLTVSLRIREYVKRLGR